MRLAIFNTTQTDLKKYNGQIVTVIRELDDKERDPEVGRMFHIQFPNGYRRDAFEDELTEYKRELNTEKAGCDFKDWLVENEYLTFEEGLAEEQAIVSDFAKAYEVAPRLIHLLADIADR